MATTIVTKNSSTASAVPTAAQLVQGELAVNVADKRIFTENNVGGIIELGTNPTSITTGSATIFVASSGATANTNADDLVINSNTNAGISILGDGNETQYLMFGDAANSAAGRVAYSHVDDSMQLFAAGTERMRITSAGSTVIRSGNKLILNRTDNATGGEMSYVAGTGFIFNDANGDGVSFNQGVANKVRITSAGNVGIGTSSPEARIHASGGENSVHAVFGTRATRGLEIGTMIGGDGATDNTAFYNMKFSSNGSHVWQAGGVERMRIDSAGNLLVGATAYQGGGGSGAKGFYVGADGLLSSARSGATVAVLNRTTSDGAIAEFRKNGTTVGSIGTTGGDFYVTKSGAGQTGIYFNELGVLPMSGGSISDNTRNIGQTGYRFKDLYLSGGVYLGGTGATNYLDDYEEGGWTPSFTAQGTNPTVTYNTQAGYYTKIGNVVTAYFRIITNSASGGSGLLQVSGLPFTVNGTHDGSGIISFNFNWSSAQSPQQIVPQLSSNNAILYRDASSNLTSAPSHLLASGNSYLMATLIYRTA